MIIITGGAGFIGSNLAAALAERGERDLVVCDRLGDSEKWRNLSKYYIAKTVSPEDMLDFLNDNETAAETIFHMGTPQLPPGRHPQHALGQDRRDQ